MPVIYRNKDILDAITKRLPRDAYLTPKPLALAAVKWLAGHYDGIWDKVLDPGAGKGVWGQAVRDVIGDYPELTGVDLRRTKNPGCYQNWWTNKEYISSFQTPWYFNTILGNPPFKLAEQFVWKSQQLLDPHGKLMFLLPADFLHGQRRARGLYCEYKPEWVVSLASRPNFTGPQGESLGTANTDNYVLAVFGKECAKRTELDFYDWSVR